MDTIDMKKLEVAITYVQRIADGYNPVNNMPLDEEDPVLMNPNVIRCMFFIRDVLEKVRENDGQGGGKKSKSKKKQGFPFEVLVKYQYQEDKSIANFLTQIYSYSQDNTYKRIHPKIITSWLKESGYLKDDYSEEIKKITTLPTEKGKQLGIYSQWVKVPTRDFIMVMYGRTAQEFLIQNLPVILTVTKSE